jgi:hypothetical protein
MLGKMVLALAATAGSCSPTVIQRTLEAPVAAAYTITSDCDAHTVTFDIHAAPDHLFYLTYGGHPPLGTVTDADGNRTTTQDTHDAGPWRADIYDPSTGEFLVVEEFDCTPSCSTG